MTVSIDLNADLGEDESPEGIARDLAMMKVVSSCNIACGGHAGSPENMKRVLVAAKQNSVATGAHPSYPDRDNFGRASMTISEIKLRDSIDDQITQLRAVADETALQLSHLKPHGALYNDAQDDPELGQLLCEIASDQRLPLVGMSDSLLARKAHDLDVTFIAEAFIDRKYDANKRLVPRGQPKAVIDDEKDRLAQGLALALGRAIQADNGAEITINAQTLCLHSDSDGALETARSLREELESIGIEIRAVL